MTGGAAAPAADAVARFARALDAVPWFAALGEPPRERTAADVSACLAGLGLAAAPVAWASDWRAAEAITRSEDWDRGWWQAEERARRTLLAAAERRLGAAPLAQAMDDLMRRASDAVMGPAEAAAARAGVADPVLVRVAAGAATQGAYQAGLARAAAAAEHPFAHKFRLFQDGRWPLGLVGGRFYLF